MTKVLDTQAIRNRMMASADPFANSVFKEVQVFHSAFENKAEHIAAVKAADCETVELALEKAYRWTQNIHDSWSMKGEHDGHSSVTVVKPVEEYGHRSTSVGDHMICAGKIYKVDIFGFKPVTKITAGVK